MSEANKSASVISLSDSEVAMGLELEREIAINTSRVVQADSLHTNLIERLRKSHQVPDDYDFDGFVVGFVKADHPTHTTP